MTSPLEPGFEELPRIIPVFPLTGALLLPGGQLPLNIFEPRYLSMVQSALKTDQRFIGMIQPVEPNPNDNSGLDGAADADNQPKLYSIGCAGRITSFSETEDGHYTILLSGACRFRIAEELTPLDGYRRVLADYLRFRKDLWQDNEAAIDREKLLETLQAYLDSEEIDANWEAVVESPDDRLVNSLSMSCPFSPSERQALLEAPDISERNRILIALLEMSILQLDSEEDFAAH
jgi:hypothetical protein